MLQRHCQIQTATAPNSASAFAHSDQTAFQKAPAAFSKSETLSEGVDNTEGMGSVNGSMATYLKSLSAFKK